MDQVIQFISMESSSTALNVIEPACVISISGDTGSNLMEWMRFLIGKDMQFPHIKVIIPTAPAQPYTPLDGQVICNSIIIF